MFDGDGYAAASLRAIARIAAMSVTSVTRRYPSIADAAADAWRNHYGAIASRDLSDLLESAGLGSRSGEATAFVEHLAAFSAPNGSWRTITELLMIAAFAAPLREAASGDLGALALAWWTPSPHTSPTLAAQRAYLLIAALGFAGMGSIPHLVGTPPRETFEQLYEALHTPGEAHAITLPATMPMENEAFDLDASDPNQARLLTAILDVVAEHGLDRASTLAIVRAAGASEGLLFGRYPTKISAFLDAIAHHQRRALAHQTDVALALAVQHPTAVVDAIVMQRSLTPERSRRRVIAMEYLRAARHHPSVTASVQRDRDTAIEQIHTAFPFLADATVRAWVHYGLAIGAGLGFLPLLVPHAHRLPYQVVLTPIHARRATVVS
jgi:AcrR family transcriptional regulator